MFHFLFNLVVLSLSAPQPAHAWGMHYLVAERSLQHPSMAFLSEKVKVEPLEAFLKSSKNELATLFTEYYDWLKVRGSKRFNRIAFDVQRPTQVAFLKAARLNPKSKFFQSRRILPGESRPLHLIPFPEISPYEEGKDPFLFLFEDISGKELTARETLYTFVDEPDWFIDIHLWEETEYGYGTIPYGRLDSLSNKSPFHVQFAHENWIIRKFAPEILEGMVVERMELFNRLAKLAFKSGHRYWGYRFTAWAMHYIQDISQPYHSKAVPFADLWYYLRFAISSDKEKFKSEATQLVTNRHLAYEDFVSYGLQQSYTENNFLFTALSQALSSGEDRYKNIADMEGLFNHVSLIAANHSPKIDQAIVKAYGPRMTEDPRYDFETDKQYNVLEAIRHFPAESKDFILKETQTDFHNAGTATRTLVSLIVPITQARP